MREKHGFLSCIWSSVASVAAHAMVVGGLFLWNEITLKFVDQSSDQSSRYLQYDSSKGRFVEFNLIQFPPNKQRKKTVLAKTKQIKVKQSKAQQFQQNSNNTVENQTTNNVGESAQYARAVLIHNLPLYYPEAARTRGVQGCVWVKVFVGPRGVISVILERESGSRILDVAAVEQVKKWFFPPISKELALVIPLSFKLQL